MPAHKSGGGTHRGVVVAHNYVSATHRVVVSAHKSGGGAHRGVVVAHKHVSAAHRRVVPAHNQETLLIAV